MLRWYTAGESHGQSLIGFIEGVPAQLPIDTDLIALELARRRVGYGRSGRQKIEADAFEILSGVRAGKSTGAPIAIRIENNATELADESFTRPRPGHADLAGALKLRTHDIRDVIERSSARETAARVALGAIAKMLLREVAGTRVASCVTQVGQVKLTNLDLLSDDGLMRAENDALRCPDAETSRKMQEAVTAAAHAGDTVGGACLVQATPMIAGLGSYAQWDARLDGKLAQAVMSIPAIKAVEIGDVSDGTLHGRDTHDEIVSAAPAAGRAPFSRTRNHAGGVEGGVSNGEPLIVRATMKPLPTLRKPLRSVDVVSKEQTEAGTERSDICAVPAAGVVAEAMVALVLAQALMEKLGGDSMAEVTARYAELCAAMERY